MDLPFVDQLSIPISLIQLQQDGPLYILKGLIIISKKYLISVSELANSVDHDDMPHSAAFHMCLHCLQKYLFRGFQSTKGSFTEKNDFISQNSLL